MTTSAAVSKTTLWILREVAGFSAGDVLVREGRGWVSMRRVEAGRFSAWRRSNLLVRELPDCYTAIGAGDGLEARDWVIRVRRGVLVLRRLVSMRSARRWVGAGAAVIETPEEHTRRVLTAAVERGTRRLRGERTA